MIKSIFLSLLLLISCKETESRETKGYYVDESHYEVVAYGKAPEHEKNLVKARNMAKESALIEAQRKIHKEFDIPADKIIKPGLIKETKFVDKNTCRIVYVVTVSELRKE